MVATAPQDESRFRRWLIQRVKHSRWTETGTGGDLEALARRLGVQPDVIIEAQGEVDSDQKRLGRAHATIGGARRLTTLADGRRERHILNLDMPRVVYAELRAYCDLRQLPIFVVLRSLVVHLLSGTKQPHQLGQDWKFRGKSYPGRAGRRYEKGERHSVGTELTAGANEALTRRARVSGVSTAALLRGMVIDLLEGRIKKFLIVSAVQQMPDDASKYVTLEE